MTFGSTNMHRRRELLVSWIYFQAFGGRLTGFLICTAPHETLDVALDPLRVFGGSSYMLQSRFYMTIVGIQLEARREMLLGPCSVALRQQRVCSDTMRFDEGLPAKFLRRQS